MSTYIYIKNFYFEEIKQIVQTYFNENYEEDSLLSTEIFMKNSRTHFIQFNEDLAFEELFGWLEIFQKNNPINERQTILEGVISTETINYKFYYNENNLYGIDSKNQSYQIEDLEDLIPIETALTYSINEFPTKNIHSMAIIKHEKPKKKQWWKFW